MVEAATVHEEVERYARGRVPRKVRERQLLALAEALFLERGYQGMSMEELARRAGVSKPVVYDLVGSKERLFELCVARAGDELEQAVVEAVGGADGIRAQVRAGGLAFFRFVAARRRVWEVLLSGGASSFAARVDDIRQRQNRLVAGLIVAHAGGREPVDPLQAAAAAACINGAYEGVATWWQAHPACTPEELADWVADLMGPGLELAATTKEDS